MNKVNISDVESFDDFQEDTEFILDDNLEFNPDKEPTSIQKK